MSFQWFHNNRSSDHAHNIEYEFTACMEMPDLQAIHHLAQLFTPNVITLNVGIAKVHPKDQYNKKIGREESQKRLSPVEFTLLKIDYNDDYTGLTLFSLVHRIRIYFKLHTKSGKLRLLSFYFER